MPFDADIPDPEMDPAPMLGSANFGDPEDPGAGGRLGPLPMAKPLAQGEIPDWAAFERFLKASPPGTAPAQHLVSRCTISLADDDTVRIVAENQPQFAAIGREQAAIESALSRFAGRTMHILPALKDSADRPYAPPSSLEAPPELQYCVSILKARVLNTRRKTTP